MRGISLTREQQERVFVKNRGDVFRLRITAHDAVYMPNAIFLHQKRLPDPYTEDYGDEFVAIASPFDPTIYPANVPNPSQSPAYFRKDVADFLIDNQEDAMQAWEDIKEQVNRLVEAYNRLDVLIVVETVRLGDELEDESVSSSQSESVLESESESGSESEPVSESESGSESVE
jgi:hypothetical protein